MPFGDRTGPLGTGPRTGRGMGFCGGYDLPGYANPAHGGWNRGGRGRGRGWRHWFYATGLTGWQRAALGSPRVAVGGPVAPAPPLVSREQEMNALQVDLQCLEETAERLRRRIAELKAEPQSTGQPA